MKKLTLITGIVLLSVLSYGQYSQNKSNTKAAITNCKVNNQKIKGYTPIIPIGAAFGVNEAFGNEMNQLSKGLVWAAGAAGTLYVVNRLRKKGFYKQTLKF